MDTPEAGWYPDPQLPGQARYWDGTTWTDHVHPLDAGEGPEPASAMDAAAHEPIPHEPIPHAPMPAGDRPPAPVSLLAIVAGLTVLGAGVAFVFGSMGRDVPPDPQPPAPIAEAPAPVDDQLGEHPAAEVRRVEPTALDDAGCEEVDPGDGSEVTHIDLPAAPPPADLYDVPLPAWGRHTAQVLPVIAQVPTSPLDIRVLLHNLEHGGIVVWLDPTAVSLEDRDDAEGWLVGLLTGGFTSDLGANVYASFTPADVDVAPVSLRAWGVAVDCPAWDAAAADLFVATHYGTRGAAPEGSFGPYPEDGPLLGP